MATLLIIFGAVLASTLAAGIPANPMENPDLFGGDMLGVFLDERNAIATDNLRWPNGVVPFYIDPSLNGLRSRIINAMNHYQQYTCIRFKERTNERNYVHLFRGKGLPFYEDLPKLYRRRLCGAYTENDSLQYDNLRSGFSDYYCYSMVGMTGTGGQYLSLGQGCESQGIIIHELGHAIGFYHEQNRSDRDNFINIFWNNIENGMASQFAKLAPTQNRLLDRFDYNSIMLYGDLSFSKDGYSRVMSTKQGGRLAEVYNKPGLSQSDIIRIKKLYRC